MNVRLGGFARRVVKAAAAGALHYTGIRQLVARAARVAVGGRRVVMISYHRVVDDFEREARQAIPGLLVSQQTLAHHVDELVRAGYDIVPLGEALDVVSGTKQQGRDVAVLTFDDGYRDVYDFAFPILKKKGVPATVFLASGYVGTDKRFAHDRLFHLVRLGLGRRANMVGPNVVAAEALDLQAAAIVEKTIAEKSSGELERIIARMAASLGLRNAPLHIPGAPLNWEMCREMQAAGITFGGHTVNHIVLTHESDETVERELRESKRQIEQQLGQPCVDFAYPNGYYDRRIVGMLTRLGFRSAVTTEDMPNRVGGDLFRLKRKTLWENFSQGPFGYSSALTGCHLDDVFTLLALTKTSPGERNLDPSDSAAATRPSASAERANPPSGELQVIAPGKDVRA